MGAAELDYPVMLEPLAPEDGGGFLASAPDLPGCMSDGDTPEEAVRNVADAIRGWIDQAQAMGRAIPAPTRRRTAAG